MARVRGRARPEWRDAGLRRSAAGLRPELLVEGSGLRVWLDLIGTQPPAQLPVDLHGADETAAFHQRLHQGALRTLPARLSGHCLAQVTLRRGQVSRGQCLPGQRLQRLQIRRFARPLLLEHPLLEEPLQQRAGVQGDGSLEGSRIAAGDRRIELEEIDVGALQVQEERMERRAAQAVRL